MQASERVKKAHVAIMAHKKWCAYGPLLATGTILVDARCPTAATNGWDVRYGSAFIDTLRDEELRFVVLHENTHKAFRHLAIYRHLADEDPRLANVAMDSFINLYLFDIDAGDGFIRMPAIGVQPDPRFRGMSTEQIYRILKDEREQQSEQSEDGDGEGEDGSGFDMHDWEDAQSIDEAQQADHAEQIENALRQGETIHRQKNKGDGAGNAAGSFGSLLTPQVDWRSMTRQFVRATCRDTSTTTWRKPNRRLVGEDVYLPSPNGKTVKHLVVGMDTSGSCFGTDEMTRFVSELSSIVKDVKPKRVTVVYWDWEVQGTQEFRNGQFAVQSLKPRGGGGTDGSVLAKWVRDQRIKPDAIIQFTDGYVGSWGEQICPTLWAVTTEKRAPFGLTINIK